MPQEVVNFAHALAVLGILDLEDGVVARVNAANPDESIRTDNDGSNSVEMSSRLWSTITQVALPMLAICKPQVIAVVDALNSSGCAPNACV